MKHAHFYLPATQWQPDRLRLAGDEARHCVQVLRHRPGDQVVVFDGEGRKAMATIETAGKDELTLSVLEVLASPRPRHPLTLVQAVTKGESFEWIVEKAVELGVWRILPVISERSVVRLDQREAAKKHEKWRRLVLEACKQCGQAWLPEITVPQPLKAALGQTSPADLRLIASLREQARPLRDWCRGQQGGAIAIGPEGDFSESEHHFLLEAGWREWSLGKLVLRSETAAVCALSILGYELDSQPLPHGL